MKTETRQKLVKCINRLQDQIKGGPGSGPRPGMGHSLAAHNASKAAGKGTGARDKQLRDVVKRAEALSDAARKAKESGNHADAKKYHELAAKHHGFVSQMLKSKIWGNTPRHKIADESKRDHAISLHEEAARLHSHAAEN